MAFLLTSVTCCILGWAQVFTVVTSLPHLEQFLLWPEALGFLLWCLTASIGDGEGWLLLLVRIARCSCMAFRCLVIVLAFLVSRWGLAEDARIILGF